MADQRPTTMPTPSANSSAAEASQLELFDDIRPPVLVAWGVGVNSTAMLIELVESGNPPDHVLFADTGSEKAATYAFLPLFTTWLLERAVPVDVVRYEPQNFKNFPPYRTLDENCLTNG